MSDRRTLVSLRSRALAGLPVVGRRRHDAAYAIHALYEYAAAAERQRVTPLPICICQLEGHTGLGRIDKNCPVHRRMNAARSHG